jgi:Zn-dependent alcohol dehydrogenase
MISASYGLDDINDAMQAMANYQVVKAAIKFQ